MRTSFLAIIFFLGIIINVPANPINPYNSLFISEVQITDSIHWAIELDGRNCFRYAQNPPCSISVLRLRICSSGEILNFKTFFDSTNISVLTRSCITGVPETENVSIQPIDTIMILDTMWTINGNWKMSAWSFPVRPVKAGHSLINIGAGKLPFETVRTSIGSLGNYTTVYNLIILNSQKQIVPFLRCYQYYCYEMPDICYYQYKFTTDSTGTLKLLAGLFDNSGPIYFADSNTDTPVVNSPHSFEVAWSNTYIDTVFQIKDTIIIPPSTSIVSRQNTKNNLLCLHFAAIPQSRAKITFVFAVPAGSTNALIQVFTPIGNLVTSIIHGVLSNAA